MQFGRLRDAVVFGAAAALGSTLVALLFRTLDRRLDAHHIYVPQAEFQMISPMMQMACIHPSACSIRVVQ